MVNVLCFSGGKDSTALLLMMIEKNIPPDRIICVDTTKEFPQMYRHIEKVQEMIQPLKIEILKIDFDYFFGEHIMTKGNRIGEKGYGWPDMRRRWCTSHKCTAVKKWQKTIEGDCIQFQGIAYDERKRCSKNESNIQYPLVDWKVTEKQALKYCYDRGLDWGGLYKVMARVSCWCCPLSRISEMRVLYNNFPELWKELQEMDKKSFRSFHHKITVDDMTNRFYRERMKEEKHSFNLHRKEKPNVPSGRNLDHQL